MVFTLFHDVHKATILLHLVYCNNYITFYICEVFFVYILYNAQVCAMFWKLLLLY